MRTVEAAAERLSVTSPTVSRGLKKLEGQLGVALLDRAPSRIQLNATGTFAAERAATLELYATYRDDEHSRLAAGSPSSTSANQGSTSSVLPA